MRDHSDRRQTGRAGRIVSRVSDRRSFLRSTAIIGSVGLAGCVGDITGGSGGFPQEGAELELRIPFGAGGGYDLVVRNLAPYVGTYFNEKYDTLVDVIPRNYPGAGGRRLANMTYNAEPDGSFAAGFHGFNVPQGQALDLEGSDYDVEEFVYGPLFEENLRTMVAAADSDIEDWSDIQQLAEDEGQVVAATSGVGGPEHIAFEIIGADLSIEYVHHETIAEAMAGVVRGDFDVTMPIDSTGWPLVDSGDLKFVCVFADRQPAVELPMELPLAPDVGVPRWETIMNIGGSNKIWGFPPETPDDIQSTWEDVLLTALQDEEYREVMAEHRRGILAEPSDVARETILDIYQSQVETADTVRSLMNQ